MEQIRAGHHWLLTFWWGDFRAWSDEAEAYYRPAIDEARRRGIPIAVLSTQWERILYEDPRWKRLPLEDSPLEFDLSMRRLDTLSPFGAIAPWREAGEAWARAPILRRLQELYPDPPYVVLLSNNEAKKTKQHQVLNSIRYRRAYGDGRSAEERRRSIGNGLIERQSAMVDGLRTNLGAWKDEAIIAGWGGANSNLGRRGWLGETNPNFGWTVPGRLNIAPFIWDGIAAKYYVDSAVRRTADDHSLFSPTVQIMNMALDLDFACRTRGDFYWEITTWFDHKFLRSLRSIPAEDVTARYGGFVRFGMWIARPRAVRHFSLRDEGLDRIGHLLTELMAAVDEVHADPVLRSFWQTAELVPNEARKHPSRHDIPPEYAKFPRWYALDTNLDPKRPWNIDTELPVWALAMVQGEEGSRRWLVFAQAPLGDQPRVVVTVPSRGPVTVRATPRGCYFVVDESSGTTTSLAINEAACRTPSGGVPSGGRLDDPRP
jgi:hypothetical protein